MATVSAQHYETFINGEDVGAAQVDELRNPATEELFATIARRSVELAAELERAGRRAA